MPCIVNGSTIVLSGDVGDMGWYLDEDDRGFTATDVIGALAAIGDRTDVTIRLNSGGGIATEGSAIHAALARHKGRKTILVEGIAASAASIVAMAGDDVEMSLGALLMIHDPSGCTFGTVDDHRQQIGALTALGDAMASIYAAKSGQTVEACRADMKAELWMTADQAVAKGYADRVLGAVDAPAEPARFNYAAYHHAPPRMVALARTKHWDQARRKPTAQDVPNHHQEHQAAMPTEEEIQARIAAAVAEERAKTKTPDPAPNDPPTAFARSDAAAIIDACTAAGVPAMASSLVREGATMAQATARIGTAGRIKEMVALARGTNPSISADLAERLIAEGKTVEQATAALFDQLVAQGSGSDDSGHSFHRAGTGGANNVGGATADATRARGRALMAAELERQNIKPLKKA